MSLIVTMYPSGEPEEFRKSRRNLDLKIKRFCVKHYPNVLRATIMFHRGNKCKSLRDWTPNGHIMLIHNSDYEKWANLVREKFSEWKPRIEQIVDLNGDEK